MKGYQGFQPKQHPLGWGDEELAFLINQGLSLIDLYRAMGYQPKGTNVNPSFRKRVERLTKP
jgi:hypothetical protein